MSTRASPNAADSAICSGATATPDLRTGIKTRENVLRMDDMAESPAANRFFVCRAGAPDDAGSPVSESVLGPAAGLNADRQHDHIYDSIIPTFIHFNLPLHAAGWIACMVL